MPDLVIGQVDLIDLREAGDQLQGNGPRQVAAIHIKLLHPAQDVPLVGVRPPWQDNISLRSACSAAAGAQGAATLQYRITVSSSVSGSLGAP